ncbi:hypothetical protein [Paucisalibacillus sp. EB02]|uniref:hypothetical protein n=1 Tax=Paucisalibacillus sp. EB02 TaxID=1347087 RepID=UPI0004B8473B|nr:hypothetical protein [Paucisalibacillus sp. EB02]
MKQPIRAFAVGLFTAAIIMLIVNYFSNGSKQEFSEMPIEDIVNELKEKGYRVLSESDYISLSMNGEVAKKETEIASSDSEKVETTDEEVDTTETTEGAETNEENNAQTESTEESTENEDSKKEQDSAKNFKLVIESGMPSSTISNELEANGIIDDAAEFISYLEDEGYAVRIQLGEFQLTSDMSYFEIAEALTK